MDRQLEKPTDTTRTLLVRVGAKKLM